MNSRITINDYASQSNELETSSNGKKTLRNEQSQKTNR